jgi:hypothetical protein
MEQHVTFLSRSGGALSCTEHAFHPALAELRHDGNRAHIHDPRRRRPARVLHSGLCWLSDPQHGGQDPRPSDRGFTPEGPRGRALRPWAAGHER